MQPTHRVSRSRRNKRRSHHKIARPHTVLCPVTGQPDWGTLLVEYRGPTIDRAGLLKYIASLRREIEIRERLEREAEEREGRRQHVNEPFVGPRTQCFESCVELG